MTPSPTPADVPRRRNGRHQACEPCRRRKVSCGHEVPVCLRCRRRNTGNDCIYMIDGRAMQFGPATSNFVAARLETVVADTTDSEPSNAERRADHQMHGPIITPPLSLGQASAPRPGDATASPPPGPALSATAGFLGPTSFSAVYLETESSLASFQGQATTASPSNDSPNFMQPAQGTPNLSFEKQSVEEVELLNKGIEVLQLIPDASTGKTLFRRHINPNDGWNRMAAEHILNSIYEEFGSGFRHRSTCELREMAARLTANSKKRLDDNIQDSSDWLASFSGPNLRWDTLGIVFTSWAFGSFNDSGTRDVLDSLAALWQDSRGRRSRIVRYKEAAGKCITLADQYRNYSTAMVYLRYKYALLESNISGDASLALHILHSEMAAVGNFAGMHAESRVAPYTPTAASEARRRLFGMMFIIDKIQATFTGRPPFLSRRYASTPLPLDLPSEVLLQDRDTIAAAVSRLDSNGWNTDDEIHSTTILRARAQLAYVRDGILELSLGYSQDTSIENILQLRELELETIAQFPCSITCNSDNIDLLLGEYSELDSFHRGPRSDTTCSISNGAAFYAKVLVRLEHLKNMFFLERLLASKRGRSMELLNISVDMVALTLIFWTHKNRLYALHGDFEWLLMSYAAPAGGVLCMELMNATPRPVGEDGVELPLDPKLSRSNIVQQLSLLVGFLSWVVPSAPNGESCHTVKGIIQRVMDYTLNNMPGPPAPGQGVDLAGVGLEIDMNDVFFNFDLMDTFDWLRPEAAFDGMQTS